jgi:hypothetical protein
VNEPRPPDLAPLKTNDAVTVLAGTGLWAVALIVLMIVQPGPDRQWWIWTCVAGIGLGFFGVWFVRRRDRHEQRDTPTADTVNDGRTGPSGAGNDDHTEPDGAVDDGRTGLDGSGAAPRRDEDSGDPARLSGHRDQP